LPDDSKVHFGFAVYEVSELERTMNLLCYCVARRFAMQGVQNFPDVYGSSLQRFPSHANPLVTFSHFGHGAAKFTDPHFDHFAYYLALEKNKGQEPWKGR